MAEDMGALGGWGGIIASGIGTVAGIAMDNPYMVGAGAAMGQSYHDSYKKFNENLMEERRANRLAEASHMRQRDLAQYQRELTADDRALAQSNLEEGRRIQGEQWQAGQTLAEQQEKRLGDTATLQQQLTQKQIDELSKTPKQRAQEKVEVAKLVKRAEMEVAAEQSIAQNKLQIDTLQNNLREVGASDDTIAQATVMVKLKQAGIEMKGSQKAFTGEQKVKLQQTAKNEFKEEEDGAYQQIKAEQGEAAANKAADAHGIATANAMEAQLAGGSASGGIAAAVMADIKAGDDPGTDTGKSNLERAIGKFFKGEVTDQQLLNGADTPEEKAAVQEAINLRNREDTAPQSAGALSGRLEAQAGAEEQAGFQQEFETAPTPLAQQAAVNVAAAQGIELDTGQAVGTFTPNQQRTIDRQVSNYQQADTKKKKKIIDNLRKNAPPELLQEVLRRIQ